MGRLTKSQLDALLALPAEPVALDRFWSLTDEEVAFIRRTRRDDANCFGFALQLCALRFPGRAVQPSETIPEAAVAHLCARLGLDPEIAAAYGGRAPTRHEHFNRIAELYGFRRFGQPDEAAMLEMLHTVALGTVHAFAVARVLMEELRRRRIAAPGGSTVNRLVTQAMIRAEHDVHRAITVTLTEFQKRRLDSLTVVPEGEKESPMARCERKPGHPGPQALEELGTRRVMLSDIGLDPALLDAVHPARIRALLAEARHVDAQRVRGGPGGITRPERRYALLVVFVIETAARLADALADMFSKCIGTVFQRARQQEAQTLLTDATSINNKLTHYLGVLEAIRDGVPTGLAAIDAFAAVLSPERLPREITETRELLRPSGPGYAEIGRKRHKTLRGIGRAFIGACTFESRPEAAEVLAAVEALRAFYAGDGRLPPSDPPITFIPPGWHDVVLVDGAVGDFRLYEFCTLCALRDRLRAGDVWIRGAREYRAIEDQLLSPAIIAEMESKGDLPLSVPRDCDAWLEERRATLTRWLDDVNAAAAANTLEDVRVTGDRLVITPLRRDVPEAAVHLARRIGDRLPQIRITELLVEVMRDTGAAEALTHYRTGQPPDDLEVVLAALLARATNMGPTRMARASSIADASKLRYVENTHLHSDALNGALARLVEAYQALPLASLFGDGTRSSSDGQLFGLGGPGEAIGAVNPHKGSRPSISFYTHVSDRWAPFHVRAISASESEAAHVIDGLLHHGTVMESAIHHTDGGGAADHVFALCHMLGFAFEPRIPNMRDRRLYTFTPASAHPTLQPFIAGRIDDARIRTNWDDLRRVAVSIRVGALSAATFLKRLAAYPLQNSLGLALREVGRIERTLFSLRWFSDLDLRRTATRVLNRGESRHALAKAVASHGHGLLQQTNLTALQHCASALNLVTMAVIYWNARAIEAVVGALPEGDAPPVLLRHVSPVNWEHIALEGHYFWPSELCRLFGPDGTLRDAA